MSLMTRRRMMGVKENGGGTIDWDLEWDYTMGKPSVNGFTEQATGNAFASMQADGYQIHSNKNWYQYYRIFPSVTMTDECIISVVFSLVATGNIGFRIGANTQNYKFICMVEETNIGYASGNTITNITAPISIELGTEHELMVENKNGVFKIYLDGVLLDTITNITAPSGNTNSAFNTEIAIGQQDGGDTLLKSIKVKT